MRTNAKPISIYTHEGSKAYHINPEQQLRRSVMSCLLWENTFYEDGESITDRIAGLIPKVKPEIVAKMVSDTRNRMYLRHIPLFMISVMAKLPDYKKYVKELLFDVIQRPDELSEFLAIYWKQGKCPISSQVKRGLALAFTKFNEYQLAKYNQDKAIKLRDVLFMVHAKPKNNDQAELWLRLINNQLQIPDTWEVALSAQTDETKKDKWERLLIENKLGGLALLRNLRNMVIERVDEKLIIQAIADNEFKKVLPFRFIAAAGFVPGYEPYIETAMLKSLKDHKKLTGKTVLLIDVSVSMEDKISSKSNSLRTDAANGLAILLREICEQVAIYTFSNNIVQVPARKGFALKDSIMNSQSHIGTELGKALKYIQANVDYDRLIVITDEQSSDRIQEPTGKAYMINVASNKNGIGYGKWIHIDGWSEAIVNYIQEYEKELNDGI